MRRMKHGVLLVVLVFACTASARRLEATATLGEKESNFATLLFRNLDRDHDKRVSADDIRSSEDVLKDKLGLSVSDGLGMLHAADLDKDGHLSMDEMLRGLAAGSSTLLQTDSAARRTGFLGSAKLRRGIADRDSKMKAASTIDTSQDDCVMCQYLVERIERDVRGSSSSSPRSSIPTSSAQGNGNAPSAPLPVVFLDESEGSKESSEESSKESSEESSESSHKPVPEHELLGVEHRNHQTREQQASERARHNELYQVSDATLDQVCEKSMPNVMYGMCKKFYKVQKDVVDGIQYQYRESDICFRVGMCTQDSYITRGVHSRYKSPPAAS